MGDRIARPVLVLGGGGFLGSHIVEALLQRGVPVRVLDRVRGWTPDAAGPALQFCEGDFGNQADVVAAIKGCHTVFHLVGTTLPKTSNDDFIHDLESNLLTTVRFLEVARRSTVERIVFASSGGTLYGVPAALPIPESHHTRPLCSYGIHKLAIEHYLRLYDHLYGLDYCVLRLSNPFGERQGANASQGAVAVFMDRALRGEEIVVWGDGTVVRDYVYVKDVAQAFCLAAQYSGTEKTFNIGSGHGISVNELVSSIERLLGRRIGCRYQPSRPFDVPVNVLDISLASTILGWRPRHSFEEGLQRTMKWWLAATHDRKRDSTGSQCPGEWH